MTKRNDVALKVETKFFKTKLLLFEGKHNGIDFISLTLILQ